MADHNEGAAARDVDEKGRPTSNTTEVPEDSHRPDRGRKSEGRFDTTLILCSLSMTLPMLIFTIVFIALVYTFRVSNSTTPSGNLPTASTAQQSGYLYVNVSATALIFIASWSSSLAPLLSGIAMCLIVIPVAHALLDPTRIDGRDNSLTPMQLALTLRFLDGSPVAALWSWLQYLTTWKRTRAPQPRTLLIPATLTLLMFFLSFAVFLADTWLHITTTTVNLLQTTVIESPQPYSTFIKSPACTSFNGSVAAAYTRDHNAEPCSLMKPAGLDNYPDFSNISALVVNNVSDTMRVYSNTPIPNMAYLGAAHPDPIHDYTAKTFSSRTACRPITKQCNIGLASSLITPFDCSPAWSGELKTAPNQLLTQYFTDSTLSDNYTAIGIQNPFTFGIAHILSNSVGGNLSTIHAASSNDIVPLAKGGSAFILQCQTIMYDVEYDSVNGTITRFVYTPSNDSVANLWQSAPSQGAGSFDVAPYLLASMSVAPMGAENMQDIADSVASAYNRITLGVGAYALVVEPALEVRGRDSVLVTRLPVAPFVSLVGVNLVYVVLGVGLTVLAVLRGSLEARAVALRLGILGLVADRFEGERAGRSVEQMDEIFEEYGGHVGSKISVIRDDGGGHRYRQWCGYSGARPEELRSS